MIGKVGHVACMAVEGLLFYFEDCTSYFLILTRSFVKDVVERLAIVTPSGRVDATESLSSNIIILF